MQHFLLHCNSSYPSDPEEMNLETINTLKKNFQVPVGLSDHTLGILVSQMSISIGANIIERHYIDTKKRRGPDISSSMDFCDLKNVKASLSCSAKFNVFTDVHS